MQKISHKLLMFYEQGCPKALLLRARQVGDFRPTAVMLPFLEKGDGSVLVARGWKKRIEHGHTCWLLKPDFIKGGVEQEQTITEAIHAELFEEARISPGHVMESLFFGHAYVPFRTGSIDENGNGRDGYSKGKLYLFFATRLCQDAAYAPGRDHLVARLEWVETTNLPKFFAGGNGSKKKEKVVLLSGFQAALQRAQRSMER